MHKISTQAILPKRMMTDSTVDVESIIRHQLSGGLAKYLIDNMNALEIITEERVQDSYNNAYRADIFCLTRTDIFNLCSGIDRIEEGLEKEDMEEIEKGLIKIKNSLKLKSIE